MKKPALSLALIPVAALALSACSSQPGDAETEASDLPQIVASTNVYGDIASVIAGDLADVESIITSGAQDPHSYEASATDQLTLSRADIVIENGGGYDPFVDTLLEAADSDPIVLSASELSGLVPGDEGGGHDHNHDHDHSEDEESTESTDAATDDHAEDEHSHAEDGHDHADDGHDHADEESAEDTHAEDEHAGHNHIEGFNEHVWYSLSAMENLAHELTHELGELDPDNADAYHANFDAFAERIHELVERAEGIAVSADGLNALVTEPVPVYLLEAAGLTDVTPPEFSEAIEEGNDVSPSVLNETLNIAESGDIALLAYNEQTSGAETEQVRAAAEDAGVAVVSFTETLPEDADYIGWMSDNLDAIEAALGN